MAFNIELAKDVRRVRNEKKLTQAQLAEKLGVDTRTVQNIEGGKVPKGETLLRLLWIFGLDANYYAALAAEDEREIVY